MDDDEYNRLMDKRRRQVRFAGRLPPKGDRRMSIFNPNDPNNAGSSFKFIHRPSTSTSPLNDDIDKYEETIIDDSPQEVLFEENWKVNLQKIVKSGKHGSFEDGNDVFQVVSMLNDINNKHVNIKRRQKVITQSPIKASTGPDEVHI